jgi:uncharacterized protein YqeY
MSLVDTVSRQLTDAMKARDTVRVATLRGIRTAFLVEMKKDNAKTLDDAVCVSLLRRLEKQHKESIEAFDAGHRPEMADAERAELAIIEEFLPRLADETQSRAWVEEAIASVGAKSASDSGKVMGALMKAHKGEIDGVRAKQLVDALLRGEAG